MGHVRPESADGLRQLCSDFDFRETLERLETAVLASGMRILARIDHAQAAQQIGLKLLPTHLMIFGNPRVGTLFMQAVQTSGLDLPLKVLTWQDELAACWLCYSDPLWVARRHRIEKSFGSTANAIAAALEHVVATATRQDVQSLPNQGREL